MPPFAYKSPPTISVEVLAQLFLSRKYAPPAMAMLPNNNNFSSKLLHCQVQGLRGGGAMPEQSQHPQTS